MYNAAPYTEPYWEAAGRSQRGVGRLCAAAALAVDHGVAADAPQFAEGQAVDDVVLSAGDRVLVYALDAPDHRVHTVPITVDPIIRDPANPTPAEAARAPERLAPGTLVYVARGTRNGRRLFVAEADGGCAPELGAVGVNRATGNVGLGRYAGRRLVVDGTGTDNVLVGAGAGADIAAGSGNVVVGRWAGTADVAGEVVLANGAGAVMAHWDREGNRPPPGSRRRRPDSGDPGGGRSFCRWSPRRAPPPPRPPTRTRSGSTASPRCPSGSCGPPPGSCARSRSRRAAAAAARAPARTPPSCARRT